MKEEQQQIILKFLELRSRQDARPLDRVLPWVVIAAVVAVIVYVGWSGYQNKIGELSAVRFRDRVSLPAIVFVVLIAIWSLNRRIQRVDSLTHWMMRAMLFRPSATSGTEGAATDESGHRWPWGSHHTELLGHLEAAARQFWVLYDPADPSTAPTNEMVADWLRQERSVSKDKAQAIASILRADGLKTGPRR